jgi:hypothetical protein
MDRPMDLDQELNRRMVNADKVMEERAARLKQIQELILKLETPDELREVGNYLGRAWKLKRSKQMIAVQESGRVSLGKKVSFEARGRLRTGVVVRFNTKTVAVNVEGQVWRVSPDILRTAD